MHRRAAALASAATAFSLLPTLADEWQRAERKAGAGAPTPGPRAGRPVTLLVVAHPDDETLFFAPTIAGFFSPSGTAARRHAHSMSSILFAVAVSNARVPNAPPR